MNISRLSGHCYCGAVQFEVSGKSDWVGIVIANPAAARLVR